MAIRITSKTRSAIQRPSSKAELRFMIEQELKRQGRDVDLNFIDTSEITDMSYLFNGLYIGYIKIDEWDTSNVTNMSMMFYGCKNFKWTGLDGWDVSNVINMNYMFYGCRNFNSDLSAWDTSGVKDMSEMFYDCTKFKYDLSIWNVSNVEEHENMFEECPNMLDNPYLQPKFPKPI